MTELDHLNCELKGRNLIEASAGTGKTYAITSLYLRLLVETGIAPENILVVTYTEAATEELRGRIRERIARALDAFSGMESDDPFLMGLAGNENGLGPEKHLALERLELALNSFDTAAIFTIHGFCLRALQENAFESGSLYDTELVTDQGNLMQEVVDDFWRSRFFSEPAPLLACALRNGCSPAGLLRFVKAMPLNPKTRVVPRFTPAEIGLLEERSREVFEEVKKGWMKGREEIESILASDKGLARNADAYRADLLPSLLGEMDSFIAGDNPFDLFDGFGKFTRSGISRGTKPKGTPPVHPFFDLCERLEEAVRERLLALRWECLEYVAERLPERKRKANIRYFDDLLNDLWQALQGERGRELAGALGGRYRAALIDEFQDTDPVQYDIFRSIYEGTEAPLFLIGDPKQAIYSFRGADIFAYLEAVKDAEEERRFTLTGNWRSTPKLLHAFNTLFEYGDNPFVFPEIGYHPVRPGRSDGGDRLDLAEGDAPPLQIWRLPTDEMGTAPGVGRANEEISAAVAAEIARLLAEGRAGRALIGGRPLSAGDIAVIVRSHRQAGYIQDALNRLSIPTVLRSDMSIFQTREAGEVFTLMTSLADAGCEAKLRAALVTDMIGLSGDEIARLLEDEPAWEERLERFREYREEWLDHGFMVMFHGFMLREGVRGRLLRRPDGKRRLTNLLHCAEVIHKAAHESGLGIEGLTAWFGGRISAGDQSEEHQIRLETDEKAVRIVTVHVSKGLEYPVVFVPFMWGGIREDCEAALFHDHYSVVRDFGSPELESNRRKARRESLAEALRLLYVAVTRAKYRCYLVAGKVTDRTGRNRPETSPLAWLFHASWECRKSLEPVESLASEVAGTGAEVIADQLEALAARGDGSIAVMEMPEPAGAFSMREDEDGVELSCRSFTGTISDHWRVASFTSFAAHGRVTAELPDRDESPAEETPGRSLTEQPPAGEMSIFTFPKGAQAGIFLHGIFEELDFAGYSRGQVDSLALKGIERFGYDKGWLPHIGSMVDNVVRLPLNLGGDTLALAGLKPGNWLTELEFYFPLRFMTSDTLKGFLRRWGDGYDGADLKRLCTPLGFKPVEGMVRGFMDMVFEHGGRYYLVDWKSNHLGYRPEDYARERLKEEITSKLYPLQYLLYTVALNRYLSRRVSGYGYASHFGGVLYFFLRGVKADLGEGFGVFRDLPPGEMIEDLTGLLIRHGG
jgi:exodeoxyribonuclease V beta subunit